MSHRFGEITQNGYVVPNLDIAMTHWAEVLGVGPWLDFGPLKFDRMVYRGAPTEAQCRIAVANSGDLQIELIEILDDHPSCYREFLDATGGRGGLQHVSSWPSSEDYDRYVQEFDARGGDVLFEGSGGGTRFIYFDTGLDFGTVFEIADLAPETKKLFESVREAAKSWDGQTVLMNG